MGYIGLSEGQLGAGELLSYMASFNLIVWSSLTWYVNEVLLQISVDMTVMLMFVLAVLGVCVCMTHHLYLR